MNIAVAGTGYVGLSIATLLAQRGISTVQDARDFFEPNIEKLHDPFLMKDMNIAVDRLSKAIVHDEKIMVFSNNSCYNIYLITE